jgi:hypothetical protein
MAKTLISTRIDSKRVRGKVGRKWWTADSMGKNGGSILREELRARI